MEQASGKQEKTKRHTVSLWLAILLFGIILAMAFTITFLVLLHLDIIRCVPKDTDRPVAEATSAAPTEGDGEEPAQTPSERQGQTQTEQPTAAAAQIADATEAPAVLQTEEPAAVPTEVPAEVPTETHTAASTETPTVIETGVPTAVPTEAPTVVPTAVPTEAPTEAPTAVSTKAPTAAPTATPTPKPTATPTPKPTAVPTAAPTAAPSDFLFGGKKVKVGETKIDGKKLGINGKKNKLTHITEDEVHNLVTLCPDLETLELEYCFMDDYTPLKNLVKLRSLKLIYCGAGKGNAIEKIDWVKDLAELRTLNLSHNKIDDTASLEGLKNLTYLNISGNPLTDEDLKPVSKLTNLETLYLYDLKKITDVSPLAKLTKLTFLHIGHNSKLKNVKSLTSLKKLKYLRLNNTKFSDLSYIGKFTALYKLDISNCPIDTDTVKYLPNCKKLKTIVLDQTDNDIFWAILDGPIGPDWDVHLQFNWSD